MRYVSVAAILLTLAACANNEAGVAAPAASASGAQLAQQTCHREMPIGSNIPVTRCAPVDNGRSVQQMIDDLPKTGATNPVTMQR